MQAQPGLIHVVNVADPFPGLRRITFEGERLRAFPPECPAAHIKLFFPKTPEGIPDLPRRDVDGRKLWPRERPITRTYSVRSFDPVTQQLSVDFVLHAAPGHASDWARGARPGLCIGIAGPAVLDVFMQTPNWNLFVGDLSALPMISALVERLPDTASAEVLLELPTETPVTFNTNCRIVVTQRLGHTGETLLPLLRRVTFPELRSQIRVCIAGESAVTVAMRKYLEQQGIAKAAMYSVPYWKNAATEEEYHQERHAQMDAMDAS
jgi:NADPH-dependent ferric siderophore reductase